MKKNCCYFLFIFCFKIAVAQFAPPAGQIGTTAMHKDSSAFVAWATGCTLTLGYQDISDTTLGYAATGTSASAVGIAGTAVVSLGDGGSAILTFASPVKNGTGYDFAVFENSFSDTFLELAFVEVSSDGINFFRFPATSNTQDTLQTSSFGSTDATFINNLAGKYRALYGTPFDLQELSSISGLDVNQITHIKIIDVVGSIDSAYATYDQYGKKVNDPWSTPFASSGFDLDAVGVINQQPLVVEENNLIALNFSIYPNPIQDNTIFQYFLKQKATVSYCIKDIAGKELFCATGSEEQEGWKSQKLMLPELSNGIYFLQLKVNDDLLTKKIVYTK